MRMNIAAKRNTTHEGAPASRITPLQELRRSVLSCLLWEDTFYESGESIAERISRNARIVDPHSLANLAIEARQSFHLRHVPLLLLNELSITGRGIPGLIRNTVESVISRPDEMAELLAIYWKNGRKLISNGLRKGLRQAALNFDSYQLNKWDRDGAIKMRDVIFMSHISFPDTERATLAANIVNRSFYPEQTKGGYRVKEALGIDGTPHTEMPQTWEALIAAAGSDRAKRKDIWTELLRRTLDRKPNSLGYMALLRNLRNMVEDGVSAQLIETLIEARIGARRILPFRFIQASKVTPQFYRSLDDALKGSVATQEALPGVTAVCVDCSGSMMMPISANSQVHRMDAAAALAGCINGRVRLVAFGESAREIQPISGLGCSVALAGSGVGHATNAHLAMKIVNQMSPLPDRVIIITDEQVTRALPSPPPNRGAYIINVGPYKNGIGYGEYTKIDGFSASTLDYIREVEAMATHFG